MKPDSHQEHFVLALSCTDGIGIVAAVSGFISELGGSIVESGNHSDRETGLFFMREEMFLPSGIVTLDEVRSRFSQVAERHQMQWSITPAAARKRIALLVSKDEHCLYDLLSRQRSGELGGDIVCVVSNHASLGHVVRWHDIPFHHVAVEGKDKSAGFNRTEQVLTQYEADVVVLARYMQILPPELCAKYAGRMINIHHSVLPSFKGARPYHQAHERGVKLIGATCHYVTSDLDEGPIIEQDVIRIDHSDTVADLRRAGKDIEKAVLARGLRWHLEDRVFLNGKRTVVFR